MFLGLDQFRELLPLFLSGVDTSWVLGTSVQQELQISVGDTIPTDHHRRTTEPSSAFCIKSAFIPWKGVG
jgi:hypothetical protein